MADGATYRRELTAFLRAVEPFAAMPSADELAARAEHQLECLRDWSLHGSLDDARAWLEREREEATMTVEVIPLRACRGWVADEATGDMHHASGDFFHVHGVRVGGSGSREVGARGWDQPILTQVGCDGGILGLLRKRFDGIPHYLLEAKAEPGNYRILQLSPTLQATFANLRHAHEGAKPRFAEYFETPERAGATVLYDAWLSEDGGRLFNKRNRGMLVEVEDDVSVPPHFRWFSMFQIKALLHDDACVNPHVRGIIAHL